MCPYAAKGQMPAQLTRTFFHRKILGGSYGAKITYLRSSINRWLLRGHTRTSVDWVHSPSSTAYRGAGASLLGLVKRMS